MPSGLRTTKAPQLEIYYEQPWGGVASDKNANDIQPNEFVKCDGVTIRNGILCFRDITAQNSIYNLNTLNPPAIPPYTQNGQGGVIEIAIVNITPTDLDYRTGVYNGRIYEVASTLNLLPDTTIGVTGTTNSVGDYDFNGTDFVDVIIDATHFHTPTPYLSAYTGSPDVTGGEFSVFVENNTGDGFGFIPVLGGGYVAIGAGVLANGGTITLPSNYTVANSYAFVNPGSTPLPAGNPLVSGVHQAVYNSGTPLTQFENTSGGPATVAPPTNYAIVAYTAGAAVTITTDLTGTITYIAFTTANGDSLCFAVGVSCPNGTSVATSLPASYTTANMMFLAGAATVIASTGHTMQGVQWSHLDGSHTTQTQYNDNQSNIWEGNTNLLAVFWAGSGITTTALTNANGIIIPTAAGTQLCLFAGNNIEDGQSITLPEGFPSTTLGITTSMCGFLAHGDAEAICWTYCEIDTLTVKAKINSYDDNWPGYVNLFGIIGTLFVPSPPPAENWTLLANAALVFNVGEFLCCVDQVGFAYLATQKTDGTVAWNVDQVADQGPSQSFGTPTAVKVIDGVAYISVYQTNTLYAYTPQVSYVTATDYVAGKYMEIFDEYLLQLNTNSLNKDSSDGIQPTRINWSSPDEFEVWDPSVNRTAGYQSITSAADYITGFVAVDNVGYIFRRTGITQITATGVAIQPFNFTTYWNSDIGQGLLFPGTLKQFGRFVFLTTDTAVYMFYGGSFTAISEKAAAAIYQQLENQSTINSNTNTNIAGGISIYPLNDSIPLLEYILITTYSNTNPNVVFWFYNPEGKTWTSVTKNLYDLISAYTGTEVSTVIVNFIRTSNVFLNYVVSQYYSNTPNYAINAILLNATYTDDSGNHTASFVLYDIASTPTSTDTYTPGTGGNIDIICRQEEIKLGRQPTIRRVVLKACGSGTLFLTVNGVDFGTIVLDGTNVPKTYKSKYGIYTGEEPQLEITSTNFYGQINKWMLAGTYADGDID